MTDVVSLAQAKGHLRALDFNDDDLLIDMLKKAAIDAVFRHIHRVDSDGVHTHPWTSETLPQGILAAILLTTEALYDDEDKSRGGFLSSYQSRPVFISTNVEALLEPWKKLALS